MDNIWIYLIGGVILLLFTAFIGFLTRYKRCPSDRILVIYGSVGAGRSARCMHGGAAFVLPILQDYQFLDLRPMSIDIQLNNALSKQNIRVSVPSTFTIGITTDPEKMGGDYYPKYPLGLPLLYACIFWIFGATKAATLAFLVSPVCSILAVAGMFFLGRVMAGSFAGLMAAILLGTSELTIELSNNPNSHASCLAFIVWGIYLLVKWWQGKGSWAGSLLGIVGGFLIGYAGLIRYSEGLLVLPIAVACFSRVSGRQWKDSFPTAAVVGSTRSIQPPS